MCVADIALQLLRMERRVPGELVEMMRQLPGQDLIDIMKDEEWLMNLGQEVAVAKGVVSIAQTKFNQTYTLYILPQRL